MKNKEKFAKEIVDMACSRYSIAFDKEANKLTACKNTPCGKCAFYSPSSSCKDKCKEWSESEYKELEVDWSKVPIDTLILVKDDEHDNWCKRYFAKYENGEVYTWTNGATSR